ncbi:hypothetical protein HC928_05150, partial [bacterium]|nr:hypothetical protein [bacterium]
MPGVARTGDDRHTAPVSVVNGRHDIAAVVGDTGIHRHQHDVAATVRRLDDLIRDILRIGDRIGVDLRIRRDVAQHLDHVRAVTARAQRPRRIAGAFRAAVVDAGEARIHHRDVDIRAACADCVPAMHAQQVQRMRRDAAGGHRLRRGEVRPGRDDALRRGNRLYVVAGGQFQQEAQRHIDAQRAAVVIRDY